MILVMGHVTFAAGEIDRLTDAMQTQVAATNAEDGCLHYSFARDVSAPDTIRISERWRDQDALTAHSRSAHMATFNGVMGSAKVLDISVKAYADGQVTTLIGE